MVVLYLSFFLLFIGFTTSVQTNDCNSSRCGSNGPLVRFPFQIQCKQAHHCGYPQHWFLLSCSENNDTLLQLTPSWKLSIKKIDYKSQLISAYDSEGCLPRRLLNFNLSVSPFQFNGEYKYENTLFNCSSANEDQYQKIPCLSDRYYAVYTIYSGSSTKLIATSATLGSVLLVGAVVLFHRMYNSNKMDREYQSKFDKFLEDYKSFKPSRFSFADIKRMTNQFKDELGQGAYGTVYRGNLSDEIMVAVKVLNNSKGNAEEFVNEVGTIGRIHHGM